jgi:DnaJ-class molecular chaperone
MKFGLDVPFEIGQQVWLLEKPDFGRWGQGNTHQVTCDFCEGRKEITGANGKTAVCPDCEGEGYKMEPGTVEWSIANRSSGDALFITAFFIKPSGGTFDGPLVVRALLTFDEFNGDNYDSGGEDPSVSLDDLFTSLAEADAECSRRNQG